MEVEKSSIRNILFNLIEISIGIWTIFFNGPVQLFNVVIAWNWVSVILCVLIVGLVAIVAGASKLYTDGAVKINDIHKLKDICVKLFIPNFVVIFGRILHIVVLGLIAYSGHPVQAVILGILTAGMYIIGKVATDMLVEFVEKLKKSDNE
jgi:hypothetical protein